MKPLLLRDAAGRRGHVAGGRVRALLLSLAAILLITIVALTQLTRVQPHERAGHVPPGGTGAQRITGTAVFVPAAWSRPLSSIARHRRVSRRRLMISRQTSSFGLRKIGKPGSSPFPGDAQNGPETTQLWRKFAPIVRVSVGFACGAGGLACGAS